MTTRPILIGDTWRESTGDRTFFARNPSTGQQLPDLFPVSSWQDCDQALAAAASAAEVMQQMSGERFAEFLECYAQQIQLQAESLVEMAHTETAYPRTPRLKEVELPRTIAQLRQAAAAAREGSWRQVTIDSQADIRSWFTTIGPVVVFGPNNFPFAFGSISGGDFAAAIAAGNPVIAKANSSHPGTTRLFAEQADLAAQQTKMPPGIVQLIYRLDHADGQRMVADPRIGAVGYTGSRHAGLQLKEAADRAGNPIYLELSSVNPVVLLPGALAERGEEIASDFVTSCLLGSGQFCTNPGLVMLIQDASTDDFIRRATQEFQAAPAGTLLSGGVQRSLTEAVQMLNQAGAQVVTGGCDAQPAESTGYHCANTLLKVSGSEFLARPAQFQTEAFGNASLLVVADSQQQLVEMLHHLEGNLTGSIYSARDGQDDSLYDMVAAGLRPKVGRLLNDKMPTGVAVSPAMNHGGPYPATGHPGFTAVGIPASLHRFAMLQCFDQVRHHRLPPALRNENPNGTMWRLIDGEWTTDDVPAA